MIHDVETGTLVTALEILSPFNKCHVQGRKEYIDKRQWVLRSRTNLVENNNMKELRIQYRGDP